MRWSSRFLTQMAAMDAPLAVNKPSSSERVRLAVAG